MKLLKKTTSLLLLLPFIFQPFLAFAQETQPEETKVEAETEKKTTTPFAELELEFPTITDNPSLIITFVDPSAEKEGVHLEIDKKGFVGIKSPYTFPALSIGNHFLKFKFVDKYGAMQTVEKEIIVIPRAPILNTPLIESTKVTFGGSALAGSEVVLLLSTDSKMITKNSEVDEDGKWKIEITDTIPTGAYSFTAFVRKYGYGSNFAQAMTLEISNGHTEVKQEEEGEKIHFAFKDINNTNIKDIFSTNTDLIISLVSILTLGILLGLLFSSISHRSKENKQIEIASKTLEKPITVENKPMTLRDKLISKEAGFDSNNCPEENKTDNLDIVEQEEKAEPVIINEIKSVKKEQEKDEKVVTKIDFLKNFKHQDPDDEKGKEKKVKVSLVSKK